MPGSFATAAFQHTRMILNLSELRTTTWVQQLHCSHHLFNLCPLACGEERQLHLLGRNAAKEEDSWRCSGSHLTTASKLSSGCSTSFGACISVVYEYWSLSKVSVESVCFIESILIVGVSGCLSLALKI